LEVRVHVMTLLIVVRTMVVGTFVGSTVIELTDANPTVVVRIMVVGFLRGTNVRVCMMVGVV